MEVRPGQLRAFVAVAEERHFGRAAERLDIAQPTLSRLVRALERELGCVLLQRTSRVTTLTVAGEAALPGARKVLGELAALERVVAATHLGRRNQVTVGFVASTVSVWMPALRSALAVCAPDVELVTRQVPVAAAERLLERGELDVAVTRWSQSVELTAEVLLEEATLAVLPQGHPLAERSSIDVAELADDALVVSAARFWPQVYSPMLATLRDAGWPCKVVHEVIGSAEALALVAAGDGVHLRPRTGTPQTNLPCVPLRRHLSKLLAVRRAGSLQTPVGDTLAALRHAAALERRIRGGSIHGAATNCGVAQPM